MVVRWHWGLAVLFNLLQLGAWSGTCLYLRLCVNMCIVIYIERRIILLFFNTFKFEYIDDS